MIRNALPTPKGPSGAEVYGALIGIKAMLVTLLESVIDRPEFDDDARFALIENMHRSSDIITEQLDHADARRAAKECINETFRTLRINLKEMKGSFGLPRQIDVEN